MNNGERYDLKNGDIDKHDSLAWDDLGEGGEIGDIRIGSSPIN